ncbi:hypothetical protein QLS31_13890 [Flavobacterium sp. XS2P24]|uniref:hypothetical protein n=1 Tax=Flavobacterium sp. XS2P24 TaxID=3041249 RepID=UPI0024A91D73|nr:hypothetical protein [Flavobacterium sp. XS2P24]MDI6050923.1 hypothetical protein [Flavobacterium sp. XS2P24]
MGSFKDLLGSGQIQKLFNVGLGKGDVFISDFEGIDHLKMFIVIGISKNTVLTCSVFINSEVHPFIARNQELLSLQIPILKSDNPFLNHDSYASCNSPIKSSTTNIQNKITDKSCRVIGKICEKDVTTITATLVNSGVLSPEEIELYFR